MGCRDPSCAEPEHKELRKYLSWKGLQRHSDTRVKSSQTICTTGKTQYRGAKAEQEPRQTHCYRKLLLQ